eukprot:11918455-Karenia_brevis.AAC.1
MKHGPPALQAILQNRGGRRGEQSSAWVEQLIDDFRKLKNFYSRKLSDLPDAEEQPEMWAMLMKDYPAEWRELVSGYIEFQDPATER